VLLAKGLLLPAVADQLGHAKTAVTAAVYRHALKGSDQRLAQALERALGGDAGEAVRADADLNDKRQTDPPSAGVRGNYRAQWRATTVSSSSMSYGLVTNSSAPAAIPICWSISSATADNMMIGG
jgi:hypothetical protein